MKTKQLLSKTICAAMFAAAMMFGTSSAFAQVKIGTNPATIGATNNLEVEASTAGRKTSVDKTTGQVTIADGTQGANYVLTSDANGASSWQPPTGTLVVTGSNNSPGVVSIAAGTTELIPDCPITLNKGTYQLYYYAQFDYAATDATNSATFIATFPRFIYFDFITTSGAATFPSYKFLTTGLNNGPHVVPVIGFYQVSGKITQLVVVTADNTVIKPKFWSLSRAGQIANIGPIIAVKL